MPVEPPATPGKQETPKPLDLSMPPQPKMELGSFEGADSASAPLLPDLFRQQDDDDSVNLRGRVLMDQSGEQNFDAVEGGQIIIEMKTR